VYDERQVRSARICGMVWQQQTSTPDSNQPEPNDGGPYPSGGSIVVLLPIVGTLPPSAGRLSALFGLLVRAAAVVHWAPCRLVRRLTSLPPARQTAGPLQRPDWEATQSAAIRWIEVPPLLSVHLFTWLKAERERERETHTHEATVCLTCVWPRFGWLCFTRAPPSRKSLVVPQLLAETASPHTWHGGTDHWATIRESWLDWVPTARKSI